MCRFINAYLGGLPWLKEILSVLLLSLSPSAGQKFVDPQMAKQPSSVPPPMAFVAHADNLRTRAEAVEERVKFLSALLQQQQLWQQQQQQQLKQQQRLIEQLQADLASRSSRSAIEGTEAEEEAPAGAPAPSVAPEEKTKKLAAKPSHSHPYPCKGVTSASRSKRTVSPWRRPTQAKK